jgi:hypothetical protein
MATKSLTWFGGYEGVVASRGHTLDLHLLDDAGQPFCGTAISLRPVTRREANSARIAWCLRCLQSAQEVRRDSTIDDPALAMVKLPNEAVPQLRKRERDYRAALDRRRDRLERRLAEWDPRRDADRTREELAALRWAILLIDACAEAELVSVLRERGRDI